MWLLPLRTLTLHLLLLSLILSMAFGRCCRVLVSRSLSVMTLLCLVVVCVVCEFLLLVGVVLICVDVSLMIRGRVSNSARVGWTCTV